jgi:hypothetical protein
MTQVPDFDALRRRLGSNAAVHRSDVERCRNLLPGEIVARRRGVSASTADGNDVASRTVPRPALQL